VHELPSKGTIALVSSAEARTEFTESSICETPQVHPGEHLLVSPDHRDDDGPPKFGEFRVIQTEARQGVQPTDSEHFQAINRLP